MAKKNNAIPDEQTKWFQRGYASKSEYIGWLQFNDLCDESMSYDDTWKDPFSGETIRVGSPTFEDVEQYEPKPVVQ